MVLPGTLMPAFRRRDPWRAPGPWACRRAWAAGTSCWGACCRFATRTNPSASLRTGGLSGSPARHLPGNEFGGLAGRAGALCDRLSLWQRVGGVRPVGADIQYSGQCLGIPGGEWGRNVPVCKKLASSHS